MLVSRIYLIIFFIITSSFFCQAQVQSNDIEAFFFSNEQRAYKGDFNDFIKVKEYVELHPDADYSQGFLAGYLLSEASFLIKEEKMFASDNILDSAILYLDHNDFLRKMVYYLHKGTTNRNKFRYVEGLKYYDSATVNLLKIRDVDDYYLTKVDLEKGYLYYQQANFEEAMELFSSVTSRDELNIDALLGISLIHTYRENFDKFLETHSLLAAEKEKMSPTQLTAFYFQKSQYFREQGEYDSVFYYCEKGQNYDMIGWIMAERKLYDSAKYYFNKSLSRYATTDGPYYEMKIIVSLAYMDLYLKDTIQLAERMDILKEQYKDYIVKDPTYVVLKGTIANERGDFKEAYETYKNFINETGDYMEPQVAIEIFNKLIAIYPELDDLDDALAFNKLFIEKIKISIKNRYGSTQAKVFDNLNRVNIKFLESNLAINQVKGKLLKEEKRAENLKTVIFFVLVGALILASFLVYIYIAQRQIRYLNKQLNSKAEVLNLANKDKDMLLAVISHQVKAPLANIMYFLDMSKALVKEGNMDELNRFLNTLFGSVKSSYQRVLDILGWLNIANRSYFKQQDVGIQTVMEETLEFYKSAIDKKEIKTSLIIQEESFFEINKEAIKIIFQNLIENAVRYTNHGGEIIITEEISIDDSRLLKVENTFDSKVEEKDRKHSDSTGMGLVIVKDLCEKLNINFSFQNKQSVATVSLEFKGY